MLWIADGRAALGSLLVVPLQTLWRRAARRRERRDLQADPHGPQTWRADGTLTIEQALARDAAGRQHVARVNAHLPTYPRRDLCPHDRGDICEGPAHAIKLLVEVLLDHRDNTSPPNVDRIRRAIVELGGSAILAQHVDGDIWSPADDVPSGADRLGACARCGERSWRVSSTDGDARCARCGNAVQV